MKDKLLLLGIGIVVALLIITGFINFKNYYKVYYSDIYLFNSGNYSVSIKHNVDQTKELQYVNNFSNNVISSIVLDEYENVSYFKSANKVFVYLVHDDLFDLYVIVDSSVELLMRDQKILNDIHYLDFNDYLVFYNKNDKLSLLRIKNNEEFELDFDIDYLDNLVISGLDDYGYSFNVAGEQYCFNNEEQTLCSEAVYNDVNYRGKYKIFNEALLVYNPFSKSYDLVDNVNEYPYSEPVYATDTGFSFLSVNSLDEDVKFIGLENANNTNFLISSFERGYEALTSNFNDTVNLEKGQLCFSANPYENLDSKASCFNVASGEEVYSITGDDIKAIDYNFVVPIVYKSYLAIILFDLLIVLIGVFSYFWLRKFLD